MSAAPLLLSSDLWIFIENLQKLVCSVSKLFKAASFDILRFKPKKILQNQFFIPFGRFRLGRKRAQDESTVLVGREGERAFLIDALTGIGERGSFLVTGRRGVGKSTFVESCLQEYQQNVFRRFLGSGVGRSTADTFLVLGFTIAVIGVLLCASELLEYLIGARRQNPILLVPALVCFVIVMLPFALGALTLRKTFQACLKSGSRVMTVLCVTIFLGIGIAVPPFGAPAQSMSVLILALGVLMLVGSCYTFKRTFFSNALNPRTSGTGSGEGEQRDAPPRPTGGFAKPWFLFYLFNIGLPILLCFAVFVAAWMLDPNGPACGPADMETSSPAQGITCDPPAASGLDAGEARIYQISSLGLAILLGTFMSHGFLIDKQSRVPSAESLRGAGPKLIARSLVIFSLSFLFFQLYAALAGYFNLQLVLVCFFVGLVAAYGITKFRQIMEGWEQGANGTESRRYFAPPVEGLLILKSFVLIIVSLQLAYPVYGLGKYSKNIIDEAIALPSNQYCNATEWTKAVDAGKRPGKQIGCHDVRWNVNMLGPRFERDFLAPSLSDDTGGSTSSGTQVTGGQTTDGQATAPPLSDGEKAEIRNQKADIRNQIVNPWHFTLFRIGTNEKIAWFIGVLTLMCMFFLAEYEWINRPFVNQRQPRALDRGPRRFYHVHHHLDPIWLERELALEATEGHDPYAQDFSKEQSAADLSRRADNPNNAFSRRNMLQRGMLRRFRLLESATFPFAVTRLWLPVIVVRVNLGFDSLDHRGVTHAMLDGLKRAYRRTFISYSSPYRLVAVFAQTIAVFIGVVIVSHALIDIPPVTSVAKSLKSDYEGTFRPGPVDFDDSFKPWWPIEVQRVALEKPAVEAFVGNTCQIIETLNWNASETFQGTGLVPRSICMLPDDFGNAILKFLFLPVVDFRTHDALTPQSTEALGSSMLLYKFVHFNYGLPEPYVPLSYLRELSDDVPTREERRTDGAGDEAGARPNDEQRVDLVQFHLVQLPSLSLRLYHFITAYLILLALRRFTRHFPLMPYRGNYDQIGELLDALTLRRADQRSTQSQFSLPSIFGETGSNTRSEGYETSREALDPRSVELSLLALLNDVRRSTDTEPGRVLSGLTVPTPDIHFVFDELDKLGGLVGSEFTQHGISEEERVAVDSERRRTYQLHALLSDMKRVISSAPARFIFVGGRMLHDEWVRDQNRLGSRQPLLTSIFDHEIYLPSLLVDFPRPKFSNAIVNASANQSRKALDLRIEEFIVSAFLASRELEKDLRATRLMPLFGLSRMNTTAIRFGDHDMRADEPFINMEVLDGRTMALLDEAETFELDRIRRDEFFRQFKGFLAYRSAGSPKKMLEIIGELIRPSGSYAYPGMPRNHRIMRSRDSLVVDEKKLYRIQFIDSIFRHIETSFGADLMQRDDKITINTIFIIDFLMKMHDRAFSWSSIERLDELAHIHRAPDLRRLFDSVVDNSAERFFHRVLNGLYVFRFRSELAIEIRYLSRISQAEMAALNFTLDESQELKTTFTNMLNSSGEPNPDLLVALGELYEFDQAYDLARGFFERAMRIIDEECANSFGAMLFSDTPEYAEVRGRVGFLPSMKLDAKVPALTAPSSEPMAFLRAILTDQKAGRTVIRSQLPWALRHLRIMLQIGLTYEQSGDEERAQTQYHAAQTFAGYVLNAAIPPHGSTEEPHLPLQQILKHLSVVFQPAFASAWIAEKLESGVDTSLSIVERELGDLRQRLPFVSDPTATLSKDLDKFARRDNPKERDAGSNHALVMAELHNKAGDLYFFKGRGAYPVRDDSLKEALEKEEERHKALETATTTPTDGERPDTARPTGHEGYLLRAHYHYALALHEVRRYIVYRHNMSHARLNVLRDAAGDAAWNTLDDKNLPTFVLQTAYSSLVDLSEVTLARSSLLGAWREMCLLHKDNKQKIESLPIEDLSSDDLSRSFYSKYKTLVDEWFLRADSETSNDSSDQIARVVTSFFGKWQSENKPSDQITFDQLSSNTDRILIALFSSLAGARFANRANFPDTASFEHQVIAEHTVRFLKSANVILLSHFLVEAERSSQFTAATMKDLQEDLEAGPIHLQFLTLLMDIGIRAVKQQIDLVNLAYPSEQTRFEEVEKNLLGKNGRSSLTAITATVCELRLQICSIINRFQEDMPATGAVVAWRKRLETLDTLMSRVVDGRLSAEVEKYQYGMYDDAEVANLPENKHRRHARALLIYMVTHYKYPALVNLNALKTLVDDTLIVDGCTPPDARSETTAHRLAEAKIWIDEILETERVLDAPMHFPPINMAETLTLAAMVFHDDPPEQASNRKNLARKYRWRAVQSFTMGRQYYRNISRLVYLYDDFNDRRRHAIQAQQMSMADMLAFFRTQFDERDR